MTLVAWICQGMLSVAAVLFTIRLVRRGSMADRVLALDSLLIVVVIAIGVDAAATGRGTADRVLALDSLLIVVVIAIGVDAAATGRGTYLEAMIIVALIAFIGTTSVARFIERRGAR